MQEVEQATAPESAAQESELTEGQPSVAADTTTTVAETDEQKNQREIEERQKRSERASRGIQRRFDELTADKHAALRQAEQMAALMQQLVGRQGAPQAQTEGEPRREQFNDYESFIEARASFRAEKKASEIVEARLGKLEQVQNASRQNDQAAQILSEFKGRMASFSKATPDFADVVTNNDDVDIPNEAAAIVHTMEDGPAVLYAIGKNPALASKLQGKNLLQQAMALGQISAGLKTSPQVSKAPPPGQPVGSRGATSSDEPSDSDSPEAWLRKRNAQLRRAGG